MENQDYFLLIYLGIIAVAFVVIAALILIRKRNRKAKLNTINTVERVKHRDYLHIMYIVFKNTPVLKHLFARIKETVRTQYPADEVAINRKVSSILSIIYINFLFKINIKNTK